MAPHELYQRARLSWLELLDLAIKLFIIGETEPCHTLTTKTMPRDTDRRQHRQPSSSTCSVQYRNAYSAASQCCPTYIATSSAP